MKKYIFIILFILFIAFKAGDNKSQYNVPLAAWSVTAGDIDLDGDNDIVIGHKFSSQANWGGVSLIENTSSGYFQISDSLFVNNGFPYIHGDYFDDNEYIDLFSGHVTANPYTVYIGVIYNYGLYQFDSLKSFSLIPDSPVHYFASGDVNNDNYNDIVFASNNGQFWGVMYNDSTGNFSEQEYTYVTDYFPTELTCGDLNGDNRDDIVVCGQSTEVYFSYPDGFELLVLESDDFKEGVSIVDFDLDGDNDILTFVGIPFVNITSLIIYENQGNNVLDTLEEFYFQPMSSRFFVTDFNNDSLQDILFQLSDKSGYIIYYNQGNFQLADSQFVALPPSNPQEGWRNCYCADMDDNGYNDIITVKTLYVYLPDNLEILFNDGHGNFVEDPLTNIETPVQEPQNPLSCYPNPFTTKTTFKITIKETAQAELFIYDFQGRLIKNLTNNIQKGGQYFTIKWDGLDTGGKACKPGTYIAYLKVNGKPRQSIKLIKLD